MARQTRSGVAGISIWRTPNSASASTIALITAASAGVVPPSPPERTPSRFDGEGTSLNVVSKKRQRVGPRYCVIHQARRHQLPTLGLVVAVLEHCLADTLGNSTMRLTMQDQRIDGAPDIVHRSIADDLYFARFGIDLGFADLRAVGEAGDRKRCRRAALAGPPASP